MTYGSFSSKDFYQMAKTTLRNKYPYAEQFHDVFGSKQKLILASTLWFLKLTPELAMKLDSIRVMMWILTPSF